MKTCADVIRRSILLTLLAGTLAPAAAADFVVSDCTDGEAAGTLRAKINEANAATGGTITFSCGPATIVVGAALPNVTTEITIDGDGKITLSGDDKVSILNGFAPLHLVDLTLVHGRATGNGGAVYTSNSSLSTSGVVFADNYSVNDGGGLYINNSTVTLTDTRFVDNQSNGDGGGVYNFKGTVTLTNVDFESNEAAAYSGALENDAGQVTMEGGLVTGNEANDAGAIDSYDRGLDPEPQTTLTRVLVSGNKARSGSGGAFYVFEGASLTIEQSTVSGNESAAEGGAIFNDGDVEIFSSTLSFNESGQLGGAIFSDDATTRVVSSTLSGNSSVLAGASIASGSGSVSLEQSTVVGGSGNVASLFQFGDGEMQIASTVLEEGSLPVNCDKFPEDPGTITTGGFNASDDDSCEPFLTAGNDLSSIDPKLGPLSQTGGFTATHVPGPGSDVVDAGSDDLCPEFDQRGVPRPQGEACDIGSVEVVPCGDSVPDLCGDANEDGSVTAPDALKTLRRSVGLGACTVWLCDFNGVGGITAADALGILRTSVGQPTAPACPAPWDCIDYL